MSRRRFTVRVLGFVSEESCPDDRSSGTTSTVKQHDMHRRKESVEPSFLDYLSHLVHFARRVWRAHWGHLHAPTVQAYHAFCTCMTLCMLGWG
jgi:hypothetical protein